MPSLADAYGLADPRHEFLHAWEDADGWEHAAFYFAPDDHLVIHSGPAGGHDWRRLGREDHPPTASLLGPNATPADYPDELIEALSAARGQRPLIDAASDVPAPEPVSTGEFPATRNAYGYASAGQYFLGSWIADNGHEHVALFDPAADQVIELHGPPAGLNWGQTMDGMNHPAAGILDETLAGRARIPAEISRALHQLRPPGWARPDTPVQAPPAPVQAIVPETTTAVPEPRRELAPLTARPVPAIPMPRRITPDPAVESESSGPIATALSMLVVAIHAAIVGLALRMILDAGPFSAFAAVLLLGDAIYCMVFLGVMMRASIDHMPVRIVFGGSLAVAGMVALPGTLLAFIGSLGWPTLRTIQLSDITGSFAAAGMMLAYGAAALHLAWTLFTSSARELERDYLGKRRYRF